MKPRKHNYKYTKLPRARQEVPGMPTSKISVDIKIFLSLHSHSSLISSSWAEGWPNKRDKTTKLMGYPTIMFQNWRLSREMESEHVI